MKKIIIFYLFFSILLAIAYGLKQKTPFVYVSESKTMSSINEYFSKNFTKKTHLNLTMKLLFGFGNQLYYKVNQDFDRLLLWPLISFNGLHFFLLLRSLKLQRFLKYKVSYFKIINWLERKAKQDIYIYLCISIGSFVAYFFNSLESFLLSILFIMTFKMTEYKSQLESILIFSLTYLLIAIYYEKNFSFIAFAFSYLIILSYKKFYKLLLIFFVSLIYFNHYFLDYLMGKFIYLIHITAALSNIDQTSATILLFCAILIYYWKRNKSIIYFYLIFHANWVYSPAIYLSK